MKVICKETKGFSLTYGKEYEVKLLNNKMYSLINDAGNQANYSIKLFDKIKENQTIEEMLDSLSIDYDDGYIEFSININGDKIERSFELMDYASDNSCGITNAEGLYSLGVSLMKLPETENLQELVGKKIIEYFIENSRDALLITFSTNTNMTNFALVDSILNQYSEWSTTGINPNSDNEIKLWVVRKE